MPVIDLGSVVGPQGPQGATGATGAQGIQGNPGPNQVTDQTSTNLNGVLFGSQSRVTVKPVDSVPTADSTNLVSSGGVKTALDEKAAKADLTNIQATGTTNTTGAAIPAGAYFYLNGILFQAKTQIDVNATFTVNTNCEQVTAGGLNELKAAIDGVMSVTSNTPITRNAITGYTTLGDFSLNVDGYYAFQASLESASGNLIIDLQNSNGDVIWKNYKIGANGYSEIMSPILRLAAGIYKLRVVGDTRYFVVYSI